MRRLSAAQNCLALRLTLRLTPWLTVLWLDSVWSLPTTRSRQWEALGSTVSNTQSACAAAAISMRRIMLVTTQSAQRAFRPFSIAHKETETNGRWPRRL